MVLGENAVAEGSETTQGRGIEPVQVCRDVPCKTFRQIREANCDAGIPICIAYQRTPNGRGRNVDINGEIDLRIQSMR